MHMYMYVFLTFNARDLRTQNYESCMCICIFIKSLEKYIECTLYAGSTDAKICFHIQCSQINGLTVSQVTKIYF